MKTKITITGIAIMLCNSMIFGQSSSSSNFFSGGFLGWNNTNGPNPLLINTNNINRMTINGQNGLTDGYVGIGNTNPLFKLHVTADVTLPSANAQGWKRGDQIGVYFLQLNLSTICLTKICNK